MKLTTVLLLLFIALAYGNTVLLFSAPGPEVSGLASGEGLLWVLDPFNDVVFGVLPDPTGSSVVKIIDVPFDTSSNLAYAEGKLYLTEGNSTVIHSVTVEGEVWSSVDVSGLGIQSIDDLGYEAHDYGSNFCMFLLDSIQETVFYIYPLDSFASVGVYTSVTGVPQYYGIAGGGGNQGIWLACGSEYDDLQLWYDGNCSMGVHVEGAGSVTEIAQDEMMDPGEFMWLYDQTFNNILLQYFGLALERTTWAEIKATLSDY